MVKDIKDGWDPKQSGLPDEILNKKIDSSGMTVAEMLIGLRRQIIEATPEEREAIAARTPIVKPIVDVINEEDRLIEEVRNASREQRDEIAKKSAIAAKIVALANQVDAERAKRRG